MGSVPPKDTSVASAAVSTMRTVGQAMSIGILTLVFEENGELCFEVSNEENDFFFDEIGSHLKIKFVTPFKALSPKENT